MDREAAAAPGSGRAEDDTGPACELLRQRTAQLAASEAEAAALRGTAAELRRQARGAASEGQSAAERAAAVEEVAEALRRQLLLREADLEAAVQALRAAEGSAAADGSKARAGERENALILYKYLNWHAERID